MKNLQQTVKKWSDGASTGRDVYITSIRAVQENPAQKAVAQADHWQRSVSSSEAKSKYVSRLQNVTLQEWQQAAVSKGADNWARGVQSGAGKFQRFMQRFLPFVQQVRESLPARGSFEDNLRRMEAMVRGLRQFRAGQAVEMMPYVP